MVKKSSWKTRGFPNLIGSIGEKVGKKWLENKGYKVYSSQEIMGEFDSLHSITLRMNRRRKKEYKENDRKIIQKKEEHLKSVYRQKYKMLKKLSIAKRQLKKTEEETRLAASLERKRGVGFDYIARKNDNIFFIEVKTNQGKLEKYQRLYSKIVKECGFNAMVLRPTVEITIRNSIKFVEPEMIYGEKIVGRNSIDSELLPSQRFDFNDEYNSIASKVAKGWLLENGYEVYNFIWDFLGKVTDLRFRIKARKKGRKYAKSERGLQVLQEEKEFLTRLFGDRLEDLMEYEKAIRKLIENAEVWLVRYNTYFGIGSDFVVKKNHEVYFVDVRVNQAEPKKFSKNSYRIAKEHGFKTMVLKLDVEVKVDEISLLRVLA